MKGYLCGLVAGYLTGVLHAAHREYLACRSDSYIGAGDQIPWYCVNFRRYVWAQLRNLFFPRLVLLWHWIIGMRCESCHKVIGRQSPYCGLPRECTECYFRRMMKNVQRTTRTAAGRASKSTAQ